MKKTIKNLTFLMIGIIISTVTVVGLASCTDVSECQYKKSPHECKKWCQSNWTTEGMGYDESTGKCCCI